MLEDTINQMFAQVGSILAAVSRNIFEIAPTIVTIALVVAVIAVIFSPSVQRGAKVGAIVAALVAAFCFGWMPQIVDGVMGLGGNAAASAGQTAQEAVSATATPTIDNPMPGKAA